MSINRRFRDIFSRRIVSPFCNENTFFVWEPCTHSHAEVVPGYAKYLLDAGFDVSVLLNPKRLSEGLFSRFSHPRLHVNRLPRSSARRFFSRFGLGMAKGLLLTTAGKLGSPGDYESERGFFGDLKPGQSLLIVDHDVHAAASRGVLTSDIITLREIACGGVRTTAVNPHFFGRVAPHDKNSQTRFIVVGAMRPKRRNSEMLVEAVSRLVDRGVSGFRVDIVGKGDLPAMPTRLRCHFESHGRVDFSRMYDLVERADFMLPLLDSRSVEHRRYLTTGTSGTFQLSFGFAKPCVVERGFGDLNALGSDNAVIYHHGGQLADAMQEAVHMSSDRYQELRDRLHSDARAIADSSLANLRSLVR